jgi:hypothetical protein
MRTSSRSSGPGGSKRPKVSEPRPAGLLAGPSLPSGAGGISTAEVRWILPGQPDAATARWFGRYPAGMETREDAYLLYPALRGLSVKLRGGSLLEVKEYKGSLGILDAAGYARGRIELWRKWSFPFGALGPGNTGPGWTVVHKRRWISRFRQHRGRLKTEIPLPGDVAERAVESACAVELTEIRSGDETWWSLGFEATGPVDGLRGTLQAAAALVFTQAPPGDVQLDLGHCQSYADWLSRRRVPGDRDGRPPDCVIQPGCGRSQASQLDNRYSPTPGH